VRPAASSPAPVARPAAPKKAFTPAPLPNGAAAAAAAAAPAPAAPAPQPAAAPAPPDTMDDAKAHAAALETFIRLTESDRQHHDTTSVDQGAVRAALARTAARKKPGGDRLQPHDGPPEESPGRPPAGRK
jgi:hypothetical protein